MRSKQGFIRPFCLPPAVDLGLKEMNELSPDVRLCTIFGEQKEEKAGKESEQDVDTHAQVKSTVYGQSFRRRIDTFGNSGTHLLQLCFLRDLIF